MYFEKTGPVVGFEWGLEFRTFSQIRNSDSYLGADRSRNFSRACFARGTERSWAAPMVLSLIGRVAKAHPFKFGCVFSSAKTSFSDWIVQTQIEGRERVDWVRNGTFATFGFFYLGGVQYAIYVPMFSRLFPSAAAYAALPSLSARLKDVVGTRNMITQVIVDQFIHHPFLYFPTFYMFKEVIKGNPPQAGLEMYSKNYKEDLSALWKLWLPTMVINFSIMPMHLRIPFVASVSLVWTCIISHMRGATDVELDKDAAMGTMGNQGRALQALYELGTSAKPAYAYDMSKAHLIVTTVGRDRIGLYRDILERIGKGDGHVLDIKGYKVGRDFVSILLVECPPDNEATIHSALKGMGSMRVAVQDTQPWLADDDAPHRQEGVTFAGCLNATGPDAPGILSRITTMLAEQQLDITALQCHQHQQKTLDGQHETRRFQMSGVVRAFSPIDRQRLHATFAALEQETGIRCGITETEPDPSFSALHVSQETSRTSRTIARRLSELPRTRSK